MTATRTLRFTLCGLVLASVAAGCKPPVDHSDRARKAGHAKSSEPKRPPEAAKTESPAPVTITTKAAERNRPAIRETVSSSLPHAALADAEEDAVQQARQRVAEKLAELKPPIRHTPPAVAIREQYIRKESRVVRKPTEPEQAAIDKADLPPNQVYVEYTVEVSEDQLRQLRTLDRVVDGLRVMGGLLVVCVAGFLFLRADEWSRGYLTSWLGLLAGVGVVAGLVAVLTIR